MNEESQEVEVDLEDEQLGSSEASLYVLLDRIDRRGYPVGEMLLNPNSRAIEEDLELDCRNVFRAFFQNDYEAEKEFTRACLDYYWGKLGRIIHYLYDKKPC